VISLPPTKEEVNAFARIRLSVCPSVCLSVYLLARLLKNECIDLDEMLRVDRCRNMDELINFEPDPDYSSDARTEYPSSLVFCLLNCLRHPFYFDTRALLEQKGLENNRERSWSG